MDALLFRLPVENGPPEWKVCASDWIDFYTQRGWFLLADEAEVRADDARSAEIEDVRLDAEQQWKPRRVWRARRKRRQEGTTGE